MTRFANNVGAFHIEPAPSQPQLAHCHGFFVRPACADAATWQEQMDWAKEQGGDLPDRVEQAMLLALMKDEFKESAYWSNQKHASVSGYAWYQHFYYGTQNYYHTDDQLRARAVRRIEI